MHSMLCMLTLLIQMTFTFVLITNFQFKKSFKKLRLRAFQPYIFVHNIHTCNGMHIHAVNTIKLQCRFQYKIFKLHENLIKRLDLL